MAHDAGAINRQRLGDSHDVIARLVKGDHLDPIHRIGALAQIAEILQPARRAARPGIVAPRDQRDRGAKAVAQPLQIGGTQPGVIGRIAGQARLVERLAQLARHGPRGVGHDLHQPQRPGGRGDAVVELAFAPRNRHDQLRRRSQPLRLQPGQREIGSGIDHALGRRRLGQTQRMPGLAQLQHQPRHAADILGRRGFGQLQKEPRALIAVPGRNQPDPGLPNRVADQCATPPVGKAVRGDAGHRQRGLHRRAQMLGGQLAVIGGLPARRLTIGRIRRRGIAQRVLRPPLPVKRPAERDRTADPLLQPGEMRQRPVGRAALQRRIAGQPFQIDHRLGTVRRQEMPRGQLLGQHPVARPQRRPGEIGARLGPGHRIT